MVERQSLVWQPSARLWHTRGALASPPSPNRPPIESEAHVWGMSAEMAALPTPTSSAQSKSDLRCKSCRMCERAWGPPTPCPGACKPRVCEDHRAVHNTLQAWGAISAKERPPIPWAETLRAAPLRRLRRPLGRRRSWWSAAMPWAANDPMDPWAFLEDLPPWANAGLGFNRSNVWRNPCFQVKEVAKRAAPRSGREEGSSRAAFS